MFFHTICDSLGFILYIFVYFIQTYSLFSSYLGPFTLWMWFGFCFYLWKSENRINQRTFCNGSDVDVAAMLLYMFIWSGCEGIFQFNYKFLSFSRLMLLLLKLTFLIWYTCREYYIHLYHCLNLCTSNGIGEWWDYVSMFLRFWFCYTFMVFGYVLFVPHLFNRNCNA